MQWRISEKRGLSPIISGENAVGLAAFSETL
jgi:hypothetical protein